MSIKQRAAAITVSLAMSIVLAQFEVALDLPLEEAGCELLIPPS